MEIMDNLAIEKISYTEVNKNISQKEYQTLQEEYFLSKSPEKYMISMPVKVLMFEGIEENPSYRYYFYQEENEPLKLIQNQTKGNVVHKTKYTLTQEEGQKILSGDYDFLLDSDEPGINSLYFQFTVNKLHPLYKKECTRKILHQNRFLDIVIDIDITRIPFEGNDFFAAPKKLHHINTANLRCHTRQYLTLSEPMNSLLEFQDQLVSC